MVNYFKPKASNTLVGKTLHVDIVRLDMNGDGVGYIDKKPIFIPTALINEQVTVKVIEQKSKYLRGKLLSIAVSNEDRVTPQCAHFGECGGCQLQHLPYQKQLEYKQDKVAELFKRNCRVEQLPWSAAVQSTPWHYRQKARIGVQYNRSNDAIVGFRQQSSNQLVSVNQCQVLPQSAADLMPTLTRLINSLSAERAIGHVEVLFNFASVSVAIFRIINALETGDVQLIKQWAIDNNYQTMLQFDSKLTPLTHCDALSYQIDDNIEIAFTNNDFIQVNNNVNQAMVGQAIAWLNLNKDDIVLDLFCGLGNFSLPIAKRVKQVVGVEGVEPMVHAANQNAQLNNLTNCQFHAANLNAPWLNKSWAKAPYTKVVLDPARAGAFEALQQIVKLKITDILYISCDPATLARDTKVLIDTGYLIKNISLLDMFSQTKHVETMVLFSTRLS